jgi:hypothetical protein
MIPCKPACSIYNPFLKGCAFMVNLLALGEELAGCRKELNRISGQMEVLTTGLRPLECVPAAVEDICGSLGALAATMDRALEECGGPAQADLKKSLQEVEA